MYYGQNETQTFFNLTNNRYAPLQAVSLDTAGLISQKDVSGNRYLQLIADKGTCRMDGAPMKPKSEASDAIHKSLARLQLLFGKKLEHFHSDNADEQNIGSIKSFLENQGTVRSFTAPHILAVKRYSGKAVLVNILSCTNCAKKAPAVINRKVYWFFVALYAIDKSNHLPLKCNIILQPSLHTLKQLYECETDVLDGPAGGKLSR